MAITAQDVNKLRQMTGMGMMDCKQALTEADGDFDKAIEILRKKGEKISLKRADNETKEGVVFIQTNAAQTESVIFGLACETESVGKNAEFLSLGQKILDVATSTKPADKEALVASKIDDRTIQEYITELTGKIGEKIDVVGYAIVTGEKIISYLHSNSKIGVLVALKNINGAEVTDAGKDVAMQIAAMKPVALDKDGVPTDVIEKEIEIGKEQARNEGKPEAMLEKIAQGRLNKFFKESTLLNQEFIKDGSKTVAQMLDGISKGLTVSAFQRVQIG
ncbi:translation elongation factor Ts [Cytophagaceae bacterium DM2B3-1]|uniref:Elongation factor Ts n=1 Tax=Xanthocytophaga flava TaxID=3048013 RepID=A0AAE3QRE8_9BACT|nr:translation elongation factor Ts [Xanthocytophaga flavus]MDJ1471673.1 translation elongation factor Ts [Xanthocytophaga flavus]MDJ1482135.1 translation elongation factor Ts [Xanthocytophaga flavus]MDJ1491680.1 translation elongation factor Ts [Xanthocytophaga flavus]